MLKSDPVSMKVVWTYSRIAVTLGGQNTALFNTTDFFLRDEIVTYLVIYLFILF